MTVPETFNRTEYSLVEIKTRCTLLKTVRSEWRQRTIMLYTHPANDDRVISVGVAFDGKAVVIADETRADWSRELATKNGPNEPIVTQ